MMEEYDKLYPEYGFAKHKGYGTKAHMDAIQEFGMCPDPPQKLSDKDGFEE